MARIPEVKAFLIADTVLQEKGSNKWSVIGVFDRIASPVFPTPRPIGLYVKLSDTGGSYKIAVEFRNAEDRMLGRLEGIEIAAPANATTVDFGLVPPPLVIPAPGKYQFVLFINGEIAQMLPVEVVKVPGPPAPPA